MLILTRYEGEMIRIGDDIRVGIAEACGKVSVGIEAPKEVPVHRQEVYDVLRRQERAREAARGVHQQRMHNWHKIEPHKTANAKAVIAAAIEWREAFLGDGSQAPPQRMHVASRGLREAVNQYLLQQGGLPMP